MARVVPVRKPPGVVPEDADRDGWPSTIEEWLVSGVRETEVCSRLKLKPHLIGVADFLASLKVRTILFRPDSPERTPLIY